MTYRKVAFLFGLCLLSLMPLKAQWELGGLINFNLAGISVQPGSSSEDYSGRLGFGIGAVVDKALTDVVFLHLEPMFLQKGATVKDSEVTLKFKLSYIELPIMVKYAFPINSTLVPYAMAGPSIGILAAAKFEDENGNSQDEKDNTNTLDFGLGLGGGVSYPYGNMTLFAETRYVFGIADINKESNESTVRNRGLQIILGVKVPVGAK